MLILLQFQIIDMILGKILSINTKFLNIFYNLIIEFSGPTKKNHENYSKETKNINLNRSRQTLKLSYKNLSSKINKILRLLAK